MTASFVQASTLEEALTALAAGARPVAGGSDLVVGARQGKAPLPDRLVAIDRIGELRSVTATDDAIVIGALVTHADLITDTQVTTLLPGLADAAALVGSPATRHVGTIGGNIMNASPAMDTGAPLLALGATVVLRSLRGVREVSLGDLWTAPGRTVAAPDELCTSVRVPMPRAAESSAYVRLEYRRAMEIAVVGAAAAVRIDDDGRLATIRVALSAVAPTVIEVGGLDTLVGRAVDTDTVAAIERAATAAARPISDLRASSDYRLAMTGVMAARAAGAALHRARGGSVDVPATHQADLLKGLIA